MNCGIYVITNTVNHKVYVGSSKNTKNRKHDHFYRLKKGNHYNQYLQRAYNKYGRSAFNFETLETCGPAEEILLDREDWWMNHLDSRSPEKGYNLAKANRSEVTKETKKKLSAALMGHPVSVETRNKIGAIHKGKIMSKESRAKMSATRTGRKLSLEHRNNISEGRKGMKFSEEHKANISKAIKARNTKGKNESC